MFDLKVCLLNISLLSKKSVCITRFFGHSSQGFLRKSSWIGQDTCVHTQLTKRVHGICDVKTLITIELSKLSGLPLLRVPREQLVSSQCMVVLHSSLTLEVLVEESYESSIGSMILLNCVVASSETKY